jgi:phage virion morphogenesis protein
MHPASRKHIDMFTVEIKDEAVTAALSRASAALGDTTDLMRDIGKILVESTIDRFKLGTAPDGSKWAEKSQTTLNRYGARKSNRVDNRPLFGPSGRLSSQIFAEAGKDQVEIGSSAIYAATMQFGAAKGAFGAYNGTDKNGHAYSGSTPWGNIPARPFLGISPTDSEYILEQIADYLSGALGANVQSA